MTESICCTPLLTTHLPEADADDLAGRFRALGDPARLRILSLISARGDVCACELVGSVGLSQPTVSHHLKVLFAAGLLAKERRGKWIHYWVDDAAVTALRDALSPTAVA